MQDAIREATVEFILKNSENLELALRVEKAMPDVRKNCASQVLEAIKKALEAWKEGNNAGLADWEIRSSYQDDNKDLTAGFSYLALRKNGWERGTTDDNNTSGVQLVTDSGGWSSVYFGIYLPRDYEEPYDGAIQAIRAAFQALNLVIMAGNVGAIGNQMWRHCRFRNWGQDDFMMAAIGNLDGIAGELADGMMCLVNLVDEHLLPPAPAA